MNGFRLLPTQLRDLCPLTLLFRIIHGQRCDEAGIHHHVRGRLDPGLGPNVIGLVADMLAFLCDHILLRSHGQDGLHV